MARLQFLAAVAGVVVASGGSAVAVDLPPAPILPSPAASDKAFSGWYLRGDIGLGEAAAQPTLAPTAAAVAAGVGSGDLSPAASWTSNRPTSPPFGMIDAGVGYRFNPWLRLDGTLEYRGAGMRARFGLTDPASPAFHGPLDYGYAGRAYLSAIVGLMNVYADLGTYWGFTPFVGAGAGFADNRTSRFADHGLAYSLNGPVAAWGGSFPGGSRTSFAWALMAGVDFAVAPNLAIELGYRYLDAGSFPASGWRCGAGAADAFGGAGCGGVPLTITSRGRLASSDFRLGLIWTLEGVAPPWPIAARDHP